MSRKRKKLKLLPQLYVNHFSLDKPMVIEENRKEWRKQRNVNLNK